MLDKDDFSQLELIPGKKSKPAFESREAQDRFFEDLKAAVEPDFKRYRKAHQLSEEAAMHHVVYSSVA